LRTHNQYLTIWMSVGLIGILFCLLLSFQMIKSAKRYSLVALIYTMIVLISFLTEDTLETQAGVTFVGFFTAWWLGAPLWTSEKWRPTSV
jgi:O-antigen ligase